MKDVILISLLIAPEGIEMKSPPRLIQPAYLLLIAPEGIEMTMQPGGCKKHPLLLIAPEGIEILCNQSHLVIL